MRVSLRPVAAFSYTHPVSTLSDGSQALLLFPFTSPSLKSQSTPNYSPFLPLPAAQPGVRSGVWGGQRAELTSPQLVLLSKEELWLVSATRSRGGARTQGGVAPGWGLLLGDSPNLFWEGGKASQDQAATSCRWKSALPGLGGSAQESLLSETCLTRAACPNQTASRTGHAVD